LSGVQVVQQLAQECSDIWYSCADSKITADKALKGLKKCQEDIRGLRDKLDKLNRSNQSILEVFSREDLINEPDERFYLPNNPEVLLDGAGENGPLENRRLIGTENVISCQSGSRFCWIGKEKQK